MNDFDQVRVVLFDAVGTLMFPDPAVEVVYHAAGHRYGLKWSREEIGSRFSAAFTRHHNAHATSDEIELLRWRSVVADVFHDIPDATSGLFTHLWTHFAQAESWALFPDVVPVWDELERRQFVIGIASNFDSRLITICRNLSPLDRARHIFCSSRIGFPKPRQEFFTDIRRQLGIEPHEILLVGDNERSDVTAARDAGWRALLVNRESMSGQKPGIRSLTNLLGLLPTDGNSV